MEKGIPATVDAESDSAGRDVSADPTTPTHPDGVVKELPCGLVRDGTLHRHAEFVPMAGIVRKTISRKDIREDFAKVVETVLRMCVKRVGPHSTSGDRTLRDLPMGDRDFLLMEIRRVSMGDTLRALVTCEACKQKIQVTFNLDEIGVVRLGAGDYEIHDNRLCFRVRSVTPPVDALCRFPIGADQDGMIQAMDRNPTEAQYRLFAACLVEWNGQKGPFPPDFFDQKPVRVIDELTRQFVSRKPGPAFEQLVPCPGSGCGADIEFSFEGSDFFFPLPGRTSGRS